MNRMVKVKAVDIGNNSFFRRHGAIVLVLYCFAILGEKSYFNGELQMKNIDITK